MKLYDYTIAPNPRRVRMILAEKSISVETIQIDLRNGEQFSESFQKINPRCTVPALVCDDGRIITENIAIADYLERQFPEPPLFGYDDYERAEVFTWNAICEREGMLPIAEIFRNSYSAYKDKALPGGIKVEQIPELVNRGKQLLELFFIKLDRQLSLHDYLVSEHFTYADITAFVTFEFLTLPRIEQPENFEHINQWLARVRQRASAKA